ncbi:MAG: metallophosphoesterase [FCB group bacterium]|jgi:hypothetical protein|nr:metallophosphoesterase [FCB group bacterium]
MHTLTKRSLLSLLLVITSASTAWGATSWIERSLERIKDAPATDSFDFVVTGDSNTLQPLEQSDIIKTQIREFNILKPELVLHVGDIVLGGAAEGVPAQWDLFDETFKALEPPFFAAPGNHDISDAITQKLWLERMGPTYYRFEYGNSCFIFLDTEEEIVDTERISDVQVAWLKDQLNATKAAHIFVFLHRPYFEYFGDPDGAQESWNKRWANVAEAFRGHPVRAVFAGHEHGYRYCGLRDGVHYVIAAGAAAYGLGHGEAEGGFNHYLLARVRGGEFSWAVVKSGSVLPRDVVTGDRIAELYNIRNKWIAAEEVQVPLGQAVQTEHRIKVSNPHDKPMSTNLTWESAAGWTVTPESAAVTVPAGGTQDLVFRLETKSPETTRYPVPVFQMRYEQTQFGPPVDVKQNLPLVPVLEAVRAKTPPTLDGALDDWAGTQFAPVTYPAGSEEIVAEDLTSRVGFRWDNDHLYMAVETQDNDHDQPYAGDIVWSADNVEMFLNEWSYGLTLTKGGPEVFMYYGPDVSGEILAPEVKLAVVRKDTTTTYEAAFPKSAVAPLGLQPGDSFRFNMLMNDLDINGPLPKRHWLQLVPEKGVGGAHPRVKVLLHE